MRFGAAILVLLAAQLAHAEFLVGQESGKITVLCEGQEAAFVSGPAFQSRRVALDSDFQAFFSPEGPGTYSVQCGKETKALAVTGQAAAAAQAESYDSWGAAFVAFFILSFAAGALAVMWLFVQKGEEFTKTVSGGRAKITFRHARRLERLELEDPVSFGRNSPMKFSLPLLEAGKEWSLEYEADFGKGTLPASLRARCEGKEISFLSELRSDEGNAAPGAEGTPKRKLARV